LVALRRELYASEPEDIDFDEVVSECNQIYQKYSV